MGIYPGQDKHLDITDLFNQYSKLGQMLQELPDWVEVLLLPGNHDAVRPAEPQPAIDPELQTDYNNTLFVGNPCDFSLHGVRVLSYHGVSMLQRADARRSRARCGHRAGHRRRLQGHKRQHVQGAHEGMHAVVMAEVDQVAAPHGQSHARVHQRPHLRRRPLAHFVYDGVWGETPAWAVDPPGTRHTSAGPPRASTP